MLYARFHVYGNLPVSSCFYFFFNNSGLYELGIVFAKRRLKTRSANVHQGRFKEVRGMKRLLVLILVWTLLVVTGTLVSADGKTRDITNVISSNVQLSISTNCFEQTEAK